VGWIATSSAASLVVIDEGSTQALRQVHRENVSRGPKIRNSSLSAV
jgi:hypothetical protein